MEDILNYRVPSLLRISQVIFICDTMVQNIGAPCSRAFLSLSIDGPFEGVGGGSSGLSAEI